MTRTEALELLFEFTKTESLRKHAFAVEAAMRAYARKFNEDESYWGNIGLIHDFDYEMYPTEHPAKGSAILAERGIPEEMREIILGHASFSGVPRTTLAAKSLYAVDELCGFITAVTLVRPNKSLGDVTAKSVKKKMKDKRFAAKVDREEMITGAGELGVEFDAHVEFVINALKSVAEDIGLNP
jgi:predicted hydrolase (HD superfamily)